MSKIVMVDVISSHLLRYAVEVKDDLADALDEWVWSQADPNFKEFSQKHIGTMVASHRVISKEEYLAMFDEDNDYLKEFSENQKLKFINVIDYNKQEPVDQSVPR